MTGTHGPSDAVGTHVIFENDEVRVWAFEVAPGERSGFHRHTLSYFYVTETASRLVLHRPGEAPITSEVPVHAVRFTAVAAPLVHEIENIGAAAHRELVVELKRK